MNPILYESTETGFIGNGIGVLSDTISCKVTEERNGVFELVMEYPMNGIHYEDIKHSQFLKVKLYARQNAQLFRIYSISKPINGVVTIDAEHVSYELAYKAIPYVATATSANGALYNISQYVNNFTFWSDVQTAGTFRPDVPQNARALLGGSKGSVLDVFGGEYEFDNYNVKLYQNRGSDRGVTIRYGKNLIDLKQEESIESTYTSVLGYVKQELFPYTPLEYIGHSQYESAYPYERRLIVDFTDEVDTEKSSQEQSDELISLVNNYVQSHSLGIPKVNLTIKFAQLEQTDEYKNIAVLERVFLCDIVTIQFEKLGIDAKAKVIKIVYDVLLDRYDSVSLGEAKSNMSTRIAAQEETNKTIVTGSALDRAIEHATKLITGELGGYVVMHENADGKPYEILIMDTDDINTAVNVWRWNQSGWGHSSTGYEGPYTLAATLDGGFVADFITSGKLTSLEIDNGNGTFHVDSSGNMVARSGKFSGEITGSTFETTDGIKITNSAIEFTQDINALRYQFSDSIYTTIAQTGYDEFYNLVTKICDGVISHYAIPVAGGQRMMIFASADSGFYFRFDNLVIFRQELRTVANINCGATITAAGVITGAQIHSKGAIQVHKGSSQYGNIDYDSSIGNFNFTNETSWANVAAANFVQASSKFVKENIEDIEDAEKILELRPVEFDYKFGGHSYGFIAEEVEEVLPELVHTPTDYDEQKVIDGDITKSKKLAYNEFIPYLVKMVQKQQKEIDELREKIDAITRN